MHEQADSLPSARGVRAALTGGLACGKSSAGLAFAALGFRVIDVDRVVREEVLTDPEVLAAAIGRWGREALDAAGALDRAAVAARVFAAPAERLWWEGVVHPRVGRRWRARVEAEPGADWVVEVPLLHEAGLEKGFDFVVCVGVSRRTQLVRAAARGISPAQAEQRIASQLNLEKKLQLADVVLWNEGSPEFLLRQVAEAARLLRARRA